MAKKEVKTEQDVQVEQKDYEQIVEDWFRELLHNSRLSQDTNMYNDVRIAVDVLKARVK